MLNFMLPLALPLKPLTAEEVLLRSQKAYDTVKTFEQSVVGQLDTMKGTANISFSRPGKLRVDGKPMFLATAKYDLVSTAQGTWVFNAGSWNQVASADLGIASITGISANAGMLVPATLTHSKWGSVGGLFKSKSTLTNETVGGRKLLCVKGTEPFTMSIWIDPVSYFVVRTEMTTMGRKITVVFSPPKVNQPISASRFKK